MMEFVSLCALPLSLAPADRRQVNKLTGKDDYEFGDLSKELDTRVKASVAECGQPARGPLG